jgi:multidrug efflux pump subunit AcrB
VTSWHQVKAVQRLSEWPGRYSLVTFFVLVFLAGLGAVLAARITLDRFVSPPTVPLRVHAELPGLDAATVETLVTVPLERALASLPGRYDMESHSRYGSADVVFRFASRGNHRQVLARARTLLAQSTSSLPTGMAAPVAAFDHTARPPAAIYAVAAKTLSSELMRWVRNVLVDPLREISEIASVTIDGEKQQAIRIQPEPRRLAALGLSFDDLIDAVRRRDVAPRRKAARRQVVTPGSAESIAARAVRLPNGEPIALAEVANVSLVNESAVARPRIGDIPALSVNVYALPGTDAVHVAERAHAHVAWLRANGLVPAGAKIHVLHDESHAIAQWLKHILERGSVCLVAILGVVALAFGVRVVRSAALAFAVWLPISVGALAAAGHTLNVSTAAGLMLAAVPFGVMLVSRFTTPSLWRIAVVGAVAWIIALVFAVDARASVAFAAGLVLAVLVRWLMTPWLLRGDAASELIVDTLSPAPWHRLRPPTTATVVAILMLTAVGASVYVLPVVEASANGGTFTFRLSGSDSQRLAAIVDPMVVSLHVIPKVQQIVSSTEQHDAWRLQLDSERMRAARVGLAQVGRAFAIAREGLVVDEIVNAERRLVLRMRLAPDAAGKSYAQLLLRGETAGHPPIYLHDVGVAEQTTMPRERVRLNREPAVEVTARWRNADAREALGDFCDRVDVPRGYRLDCVIRDSPI